MTWLGYRWSTGASHAYMSAQALLNLRRLVSGKEKCADATAEIDDPPCALPDLQPDVRGCERCYKNRECMMYHASSNGVPSNAGSSTAGSGRHGRLLDHFAGHLKREDLEYFRKWDRLIDLERHASARDVISKSWLMPSREKEAEDGRCISSLVVDELMPPGERNEPPTRNKSSDVGGNEALIRFLRSDDSPCKTPLSNLSFEVGSYVSVSEDITSFESRPQQRRVVRPKLHVLRGSVFRIGEHEIDITVPRKDIRRLERILGRSENSPPSNATNETHSRHMHEVKFRLDKDEYAGACGLLLQNLVNWFTLDIPSFSAESLGTPAKTKTLTANTECSARRRRLNSSIISLDPSPRFANVSPDSLLTGDAFALDVKGCDLTSLKRDYGRLNSDQKGAVLKVVSAEDFSLIQGLPGTGKSATIAFITRLLVSKGKRVLLTSYTHSAVDNLLCKLIQSGMDLSSNERNKTPNSIVRIGRESSCHPDVSSLLAQNLACEVERKDSSDPSRSIDKPSVEYLHKVTSAARVVGVSALTAPRSPLLAGQHFDVVIVDEAGQISQPAVLGAIMAADSFVLVGDHMQLPPLVVSEAAEEAGYGISMLKHLAEGFPAAVAKLTMQYRMNEKLCHLSNVIAYKGLLTCGSADVRNQKLNLKVPGSLSLGDNRGWIKRAIDPDQPVIFLDTDGKGWLESDGVRSGAGGPTNDFEASVVERLALTLSACGLPNTSIGIITPFRSQLRMLNENLALQESKNHGLEMCTIDRFQGRDKEAIIISLV